MVAHRDRLLQLIEGDKEGLEGSEDEVEEA
jgi:hypothetical protein